LSEESGAPKERRAFYTSVYLPEETQKMAAELMEDTGLGRSALVQLAIQKMYFDDAHRDRRERLLAIAEEIRRMA